MSMTELAVEFGRGCVLSAVVLAFVYCALELLL